MIGYLTSIFIPAVWVFVILTEQGTGMPVGLDNGFTKPSDHIGTYQPIRAALAEQNMHQGKYRPQAGERPVTDENELAGWG